MTNEKQREYLRVSDKFNVQVTVQNDSSEEVDIALHSSKSINVSAAGLLINAHHMLKIDDIVIIRFMKPNSFDFFKSSGKVVRINKNEDSSYKVAINFINLTTEDQEALNYYLNL